MHEGILLGGSADVQQWISYDSENPFLIAKPRVGSQTVDDAVTAGGARDLAAALLFLRKP